MNNKLLIRKSLTFKCNYCAWSLTRVRGIYSCTDKQCKNYSIPYTLKELRSDKP